MNNAPLNVAWLIKWKTAATIATVNSSSAAPVCTPNAPRPRSDIISPSCETVENASIAFKSSCLTALNDAQASVINPVSKMSHTQSSLKAKIGVNRATR